LSSAMLCFLLFPSPPVRSSYGAAIMVGAGELRGREGTAGDNICELGGARR
jgi:hypothetical protein